MKPILHDADPIGAYARRVRGIRTRGPAACCACGERRPAALMVGEGPSICYECRTGRSTEEHHVAGRANRTHTISVPGNDHRAYFSEAQYSWPQATLENRHGSPLLAAAASIRGFVDLLTYWAPIHLIWSVKILEKLDSWLCAKLGPNWWRDSPLASWRAPE